MAANSNNTEIIKLLLSFQNNKASILSIILMEL